MFVMGVLMFKIRQKIVSFLGGKVLKGMVGRLFNIFRVPFGTG